MCMCVCMYEGVKEKEEKEEKATKRRVKIVSGLEAIYSISWRKRGVEG